MTEKRRKKLTRKEKIELTQKRINAIREARERGVPITSEGKARTLRYDETSGKLIDASLQFDYHKKDGVTTLSFFDDRALNEDIRFKIFDQPVIKSGKPINYQFDLTSVKHPFSKTNKAKYNEILYATGFMSRDDLEYATGIINRSQVDSRRNFRANYDSLPRKASYGKNRFTETLYNKYNIDLPYTFYTKDGITSFTFDDGVSVLKYNKPITKNGKQITYQLDLRGIKGITNKDRARYNEYLYATGIIDKSEFINRIRKTDVSSLSFKPSAPIGANLYGLDKNIRSELLERSSKLASENPLWASILELNDRIVRGELSKEAQLRFNLNDAEKIAYNKIKNLKKAKGSSRHQYFSESITSIFENVISSDGERQAFLEKFGEYIEVTKDGLKITPPVAENTYRVASDLSDWIFNRSRASGSPLLNLSTAHDVEALDEIITNLLPISGDKVGSNLDIIEEMLRNAGIKVKGVQQKHIEQASEFLSSIGATIDTDPLFGSGGFILNWSPEQPFPIVLNSYASRTPFKSKNDWTRVRYNSPEEIREYWANSPWAREGRSMDIDSNRGDLDYFLGGRKRTYEIPRNVTDYNYTYDSAATQSIIGDMKWREKIAGAKKQKKHDLVNEILVKNGGQEIFLDQKALDEYVGKKVYLHDSVWEITGSGISEGVDEVLPTAPGSGHFTLKEVDTSGLSVNFGSVEELLNTTIISEKNRKATLIEEAKNIGSQSATDPNVLKSSKTASRLSGAIPRKNIEAYAEVINGFRIPKVGVDAMKEYYPSLYSRILSASNDDPFYHTLEDMVQNFNLAVSDVLRTSGGSRITSDDAMKSIIKKYFKYSAEFSGSKRDPIIDVASKMFKDLGITSTPTDEQIASMVNYINKSRDNSLIRQVLGPLVEDFERDPAGFSSSVRNLYNVSANEVLSLNFRKMNEDAEEMDELQDLIVSDDKAFGDPADILVSKEEITPKLDIDDINNRLDKVIEKKLDREANEFANKKIHNLYQSNKKKYTTKELVAEYKKAYNQFISDKRKVFDADLAERQVYGLNELATPESALSNYRVVTTDDGVKMITADVKDSRLATSLSETIGESENIYFTASSGSEVRKVIYDKEKSRWHYLNKDGTIGEKAVLSQGKGRTQVLPVDLVLNEGKGINGDLLPRINSECAIISNLQASTRMGRARKAGSIEQSMRLARNMSEGSKFWVMDYETTGVLSAEQIAGEALKRGDYTKELTQVTLRRYQMVNGKPQRIEGGMSGVVGLSERTKNKIKHLLTDEGYSSAADWRKADPSAVTEAYRKAGRTADADLIEFTVGKHGVDYLDIAEGMYTMPDGSKSIAEAVSAIASRPSDYVSSRNEFIEWLEKANESGEPIHAYNMGNAELPWTKAFFGVDLNEEQIVDDLDVALAARTQGYTEKTIKGKKIGHSQANAMAEFGLDAQTHIADLDVEGLVGIMPDIVREADRNAKNWHFLEKDSYIVKHMGKGRGSYKFMGTARDAQGRITFMTQDIRSRRLHTESFESAAALQHYFSSEFSYLGTGNDALIEAVNINTHFAADNARREASRVMSDPKTAVAFQQRMETLRSTGKRIGAIERGDLENLGGRYAAMNEVALDKYASMEDWYDNFFSRASDDYNQLYIAQQLGLISEETAKEQTSRYFKNVRKSLNTSIIENRDVIADWEKAAPISYRGQEWSLPVGNRQKLEAKLTSISREIESMKPGSTLAEAAIPKNQGRYKIIELLRQQHGLKLSDIDGNTEITVAALADRIMNESKGKFQKVTHENLLNDIDQETLDRAFLGAKEELDNFLQDALDPEELNRIREAAEAAKESFKSGGDFADAARKTFYREVAEESTEEAAKSAARTMADDITGGVKNLFNKLFGEGSFDSFKGNGKGIGIALGLIGAGYVFTNLLDDGPMPMDEDSEYQRRQQKAYAEEGSSGGFRVGVRAVDVNGIDDITAGNMIQEAINSASPNDVRLNINSTDNTQRLDDSWYQQRIASAIGR